MVTFVNLPKTQQLPKIGFQFGFGDMMWVYYGHTFWFGNEGLFPVRYTFVNVAKLDFKLLQYISPWIVLIIYEAPCISLNIDLSLYSLIFIAVSPIVLHELNKFDFKFQQKRISKSWIRALTEVAHF